MLHRISVGWGAKLPLAKIYSEILEISSEVVRFSSELMQISSELVQISSEPVQTNLELLIISAFRKSATLVSETLVSLRNRAKRQRLCFSFIQNFVKTTTNRTSKQKKNAFMLKNQHKSVVNKQSG